MILYLLSFQVNVAWAVSVNHLIKDERKYVQILWGLSLYFFITYIGTQKWGRTREASTCFRIFFFFIRIRIRIMTRIRISLCNSLEKVILYILKILTKFGVAPQSFCENRYSVQDRDQDHDFTLDFNTRPTFHPQKTPTKFCLDPLTPSKVIVSAWKVHVQTDRQTDRRADRQTGRPTGRHTDWQTDRQADRQTGRQTDGRTEFFLLVLSSKLKHEHSSKGENFFFTYAITMLSLLTYFVCDEKVKKRKKRRLTEVVREGQRIRIRK